jgi:hypothetical protein
MGHGSEQIEILVLTTALPVAANLRKKHVAKAQFTHNCPSKPADFCKIRVG